MENENNDLINNNLNDDEESYDSLSESEEIEDQKEIEINEVLLNEENERKLLLRNIENKYYNIKGLENDDSFIIKINELLQSFQKQYENLNDKFHYNKKMNDYYYKINRSINALNNFNNLLNSIKPNAQQVLNNLNDIVDEQNGILNELNLLNNQLENYENHEKKEEIIKDIFNKKEIMEKSMNNINKNIENLKIIENENNNSEIIDIFNNNIFNNNNYNNNYNNIIINNNNSTTLNKIISLMFENIKNKVNSNLFKQLKNLYKKDLEKFK